MTTRNILIGVVVLAAIGLAFFFMRRGDNADMVNGADDNAVVCTMDAKLCPDGSYVGREGPNCEFRACPDEANGAEDETVFDKG